MDSVSTGRRRRGSFLAGFLLIALGALLLLTTTGAVSFGIWLEIVDYWPVLLLLTGMEIILARRALLIRAGVIAATLVAVVAAAYLSMPEYDPPEPLRTEYVEPLGDARRLHLSMAFIGGDVELTSDTTASGSFARLLAADFGSHPSRVIREQSNGDVEFHLASSGPFLRHSSYDGYTRRVSLPVGLADWNLEVSPDVEIDIAISAGAADLALDLRGLNVRNLDVEAGASDIRVQLPANMGQTYVDIAAGATDVELLVPDNVAAHIDIASPLGSAWIDPARFMEIEDDVYRSANYSDSRNRVWVDIEALSANVTVR
ncbi:MAG: hypothetical protein F4X94_01935 [Dehalococcoidia bacterium]|nr:hypothetical protein [Dehalococcoidia bacterium]